MNKTDKIREIYRQSFGVDTEFEDLLFKTCACHLKTLEINEETVSFLFALPCEIKADTETFKAAYVFAVATDENHRKNGYMTRLLEKVKQEFNGILILRPANVTLINYYKKAEFTEFTAQDKAESEISLIPLEEFKALAESEENTADGEFTVMAFNSPVNLNNLYFPYSMP